MARALEEGRIERMLTAVGTASLLALMLIVFIDVTGRNLFNSPLPWGTEVMEVLLGLMVFVFYPVLARRDGHIVVDLVPVPRGAAGAQRVLAGAVGAALFGIIAWTCGRQALRSVTATTKLTCVVKRCASLQRFLSRARDFHKFSTKVDSFRVSAKRDSTSASFSASTAIACSIRAQRFSSLWRLRRNWLTPFLFVHCTQPQFEV